MALVDLIMPKLGESIMEATILKWTKKVGEQVKQDETVLEIATDKVDSEVPSTTEGTLAEILFKENDVVPIGTVIARIQTAATEQQSASSAMQQPATQAVASIPEPEVEHEIPYTPGASDTNSESDDNNNGFFSPLVLNIAKSEGVPLSELENITGTGNEGRVTKKDILQFIADKKAGKVTKAPAQKIPATTAETTPPQPSTLPAKPAPPEAAPIPQLAVQPQPVTVKTETVPQYEPQPEPQASSTSDNVEIIEMDRMRKMIAKHMVNSVQTSPHVTSFAEADVTNMVVWRERVKKDFEKREGTRVTYMPLFIECLAKVIKRFPYVNASIDGDNILLKKDINIGMATALPNGNLIVPVIRNADYLNLVGLSKAVNVMAENSRNNKLKPDDTAGGTFTLTNVGTFGSLMGTPIINQPQVAILAVGAIKKRPVVLETPEGDAIGIRHMMYLSLSYDHRIVDGSIGASFLTQVAKEFENWDINRKW
jgi:2-oxoglutarate dehydrogenase E2 component (dihydrolipoamide succinyltransferase)